MQCFDWILMGVISPNILPRIASCLHSACCCFVASFPVRSAGRRWLTAARTDRVMGVDGSPSPRYGFWKNPLTGDGRVMNGRHPPVTGNSLQVITHAKATTSKTLPLPWGSVMNRKFTVEFTKSCLSLIQPCSTVFKIHIVLAEAHNFGLATFCHMNLFWSAGHGNPWCHGHYFIQLSVTMSTQIALYVLSDGHSQA